MQQFTVEHPIVRGKDCPVVLYNRHGLESKNEARFSELVSWGTIKTASFDVMNTISTPAFTLTDLFIIIT